MNAIAARIAQLLQLCGEDPSAAFALRHDALPLVRREDGWLALRVDGSIVFVDDATARMLPDIPAAWRAEAMHALESKYEELAALVRR